MSTVIGAVLRAVHGPPTLSMDQLPSMDEFLDKVRIDLGWYTRRQAQAELTDLLGGDQPDDVREQLLAMRQALWDLRAELGEVAGWERAPCQ